MPLNAQASSGLNMRNEGLIVVFGDSIEYDFDLQCSVLISKANMYILIYCQQFYAGVRRILYLLLLYEMKLYTCICCLFYSVYYVSGGSANHRLSLLNCGKCFAFIIL